MRRRTSIGLTLIEMLVVLIIAAMALALGFQSLGQWRRADAAVSNLTAENRQTILVRSWLQSAIRALHPVAEHPFEGDSEGWKGVTLQPVFLSQGGATETRWEVRMQNGFLQLGTLEAGSDHVFMLPGTSGSFEYLDATGRAHPRWPPALGQHSHLPSAVLFRLETSGGLRIWSESVAGIRDPVPVLYESETD